MATRRTNFRFSEADLSLLDFAAAELGCSRTQAIRTLLLEFSEGRSRSRERRLTLAERLIEHYGADAVLLIALDADGEPFGQIGTQPADNDVYVVGQATERGRELHVEIYLGESAHAPFRIFVGTLPAFGNFHLSIPLAELRRGGMPSQVPA